MKIGVLCAAVALCGQLFGADRYFAEVDYLLWQAHQDGFFRATEIFIPGFATGQPLHASETDQYIDDNRWNSGVRAAIAWGPECRPFDLHLQYTYLSRTIPSNNLASYFSGSVRENSYFNLSDYITNVATNPGTYSNRSCWKFCFNQLDLLIDQAICIGEGSILTPYFGLRGMQLRQTVSMAILNSLPGTELSGGGPVFYQLAIQPELQGVGIVGGFEGRFTIGCGFDLWGQFGGGLVWGRFKTNQGLSLTDVSTSALLGTETLNHTFWGTSLNADLGLGIDWSYPFQNGCQWLTVTFGWENHLYTKTNNAQAFLAVDSSINHGILNVDRNIQRGDFSFQGFVLGAAYSF